MGVEEEIKAALEAALEAKKAEEEKKAEALEKGRAAMVELQGTTEAASSSCEKLKEAVEGFKAKDAATLTAKVAEAATKNLEDLSKDAKEKVKACTDFVMKNG